MRAGLARERERSSRQDPRDISNVSTNNVSGIPPAGLAGLSLAGKLPHLVAAVGVVVITVHHGVDPLPHQGGGAVVGDAARDRRHHPLRVVFRFHAAGDDGIVAAARHHHVLAAAGPAAGGGERAVQLPVLDDPL